MPANQPANLHVVIGAGATGIATATLLSSTGAQVKLVTRSGSGPAGAGIECIAADAADAAELTKIAAGARAIYNCANPPYHRWATDWPPLAAALLKTAETTRAVLVTLSNLYVYAPPTRPMQESDPLDPSSIKGAVRAEMWHDALAAHEQGRVRVVEARASDFIGPGVGTNGHMGDRVIPRVLKGKSVSLLGNVDVDHSWTAINDVARTLVKLGGDDRAWGRAWHVPTTAPLSQRELVHRLCDLAGVKPAKVSTVPSLLLRTAGIFIPAMRELGEVAYQFEAPFVIDSQKTIDTFGLPPTSLDDTLRATLASYGHPSGSDLHVLH